MAKYLIETEDGTYEIETDEETQAAPSLTDNVLEASNPSEMLKVASPSNLGKLAGVAASNAPGAASLAVNALPGVGNPTAIVPAVKSAVQNLGDLGDAVKRMIQVQGGSELVKKEQLLAGIGEGAGTAAEMIMPGALAKPTIKSAAQGVSSKVGGLVDAIQGTGNKQVAALTEKAAAQDLIQASRLNTVNTAKNTVKELAANTRAKVESDALAPVAQIRESLKELPITQRKILEGANDSLLQAKHAIGAAEQELGIDITKIGTAEFGKFISTPGRVKSFTARFSKIANRLGSDKLAESVNVQSLQTIRKAAETAAKNPGNSFAQAELFNIAKTFRDAVTKSSTNMETAINNFKTAAQAVKGLPAEFKAQKEVMNLGLTKMQNLAKEKVLNDPKLAQLDRAVTVLERRSKELPKQFTVEKARLDLALVQARNLAQKQSSIRKVIGGGLLTSAVGAVGATMGRNLFNSAKQ